MKISLEMCLRKYQTTTITDFKSVVSFKISDIQLQQKSYKLGSNIQPSFLCKREVYS